MARYKYTRPKERPVETSDRSIATTFVRRLVIWRNRVRLPEKDYDGPDVAVAAPYELAVAGDPSADPAARIESYERLVAWKHVMCSEHLTSFAIVEHRVKCMLGDHPGVVAGQLRYDVGPDLKVLRSLP